MSDENVWNEHNVSKHTEAPKEEGTVASDEKAISSGNIPTWYWYDYIIVPGGIMTPEMAVHDMLNRINACLRTGGGCGIKFSVVSL
jgi:hypothetical protein